jgi:hypothetical protein
MRVINSDMSILKGSILLCILVIKVLKTPSTQLYMTVYFNNSSKMFATHVSAIRHHIV